MTRPAEQVPVVGLEPCPFCEGHGSLQVGHPDYARWNPEYWVICDDCNASASVERTEAEAIAAWNTRTETQSQATIDELVGALRKTVPYLEDASVYYSFVPRGHADLLGEINTILSRHEGGQS